MGIAPEVSVIIPAYNASGYIQQALDSVFRQSFQDFEVIVVDDASTDGTAEIVAKYGEPVQLLRREQNSGSVDIPRYEAVAKSKGRWCAFLDADDLWEPQKLERQVAFMRAHPEVQLSHTYARIIDEEGRPDGIRHEGVIPPTGMIARELLRHCFICASTVMVLREAWLRALQPENLGGKATTWDYVLDTVRRFRLRFLVPEPAILFLEWAFFLNIAKHSPVGFIAEPLTLYRRHAASISKQDWRRIPRDLPTKRWIFRKGLWRGLVEQAEMKKILREAAWENAEFWRTRGKWRRALYFGLSGLCYGPFDIRLTLSLLKSLASPFRLRSGCARR